MPELDYKDQLSRKIEKLNEPERQKLNIFILGLEAGQKIIESKMGKQGAVLTTAQLDGALPHTP